MLRAAMMGVALLFPGQGSQSPGFLRRLPDIPAVNAILERASDFLGHEVLTLDTHPTLSSTVSTQLGMLVAGTAFWNFLGAEGFEPSAVAGMSVGSFAAAVACGAVVFEPALKLVQRRAELMQSSFPGRTDGMLAVQGLGSARLESLLIGTGLSIANFNSPTQFVVAGPLDQLDSLAQRALEAGACKAVVLRMSVPSHTSRLGAAAQELLALTRRVPIQAPNRTMFSNRHARPITTAEGVREELALNMAHPVLWHDILSAIGGLGINLLIEAPPGSVLAGLAREVLPEIHALSAAETRWDVLLLTAQNYQSR